MRENRFPDLLFSFRSFSLASFASFSFSASFFFSASAFAKVLMSGSEDCRRRLFPRLPEVDGTICSARDSEGVRRVFGEPETVKEPEGELGNVAGPVVPVPDTRLSGGDRMEGRDGGGAT